VSQAANNTTLEHPVPSDWYTGQRAFSSSRPTRLPRSTRQPDRHPRVPRGGRVGRLAFWADPDSRHRLVLVVGGVGVRQPGRLRLLRCLPSARCAGMGRWDDLARQASRALAFGTLGEAIRAPARGAQPGHPRRAPRHRHRSAPPPIASSFTRAQALARTPTTRQQALQHPCCPASPPGYPQRHPSRSASLRSASQHTVAPGVRDSLALTLLAADRLLVNLVREPAGRFGCVVVRNGMNQLAGVSR
jgi:hypothetical protein